jgi:broad specificity phosphatase PhoE
MAAQLWLLRHGEAVPHDSKPDDDRELTARGERQAVSAGAALARLGVDPGRSAALARSCGIDPRTRPDRLSLEDFARLAEALG